MLEDQLLLIVGLQHHRILVERPDPARQLHPTQQIDRDVELFFAGRVEEGILDILRRLVFHLPISLYIGRSFSISCSSQPVAQAAERPRDNPSQPGFGRYSGTGPFAAVHRTIRRHAGLFNPDAAEILGLWILGLTPEPS